MSDQIILDKLYFIIQDTFNLPPDSIKNNSKLNDFCPDELDLILFRAEIDLEYWVDLNLTDEELSRLTIQEIADLIEVKKNEK